ncbi:MAG: mechanosensitive ion channel [Actinomycetota bacterium]|jgi:small-conductance mechanosensitive channel|nr:mechanosensitive ion channel [Actinomycetota bacterium]
MFQPLQDALSAFLSYVPVLIGAIIILIVGYLIAKALQAIVGRVLEGIGFDRWMERGGIKQFFDRADTQHTPHSILGRLVFWFVFIIAITMATDALGIPQVSAVLAQLIAYIPNIIAAILILILAALLANFLSSIVRGATGSGLLADIARYAIIVYAVFAALTQLGVAVELTAPTFLIVLGAVALAAAIAFGIGGREVAREVIEKAYNRSQQEARSDSTSSSPEGGERTTTTSR